MLSPSRWCRRQSASVSVLASAFHVSTMFKFSKVCIVFIRLFEKRDILCYGVWRPSVNFFVSG